MAAGTFAARISEPGLNAERIPGPEGRPWIDTTIRGQVDRGTGLLNNALYIGRLSWNRCSYIKDQRTGQARRAREPSQRVGGDRDPGTADHIDQDLWEAVKARQSAARIEMGRGG